MEIKRILANDTRSAKEKALALCGKDALIISCNQVNDQTELIVAIDRVSDIRLPRSADSINPGQADAQIRSQEIVALVREEIAALRRELQLSEKVDRWQVTQDLPDCLTPILDTLTEEGASAGLRALLADAARDAGDEAQAIDEIEQMLTQSLSASLATEDILDGGIHALCGPSGSGKTMACLRLARMAQARSTGRVALIQYGPHSQNASGLIQTQAVASGVDLLFAENAAELTQVLKKVGRRRLVLIDSPGVRFEKHAADLAQAHPRMMLHGVLRIDASAASVRRMRQAKGVQWKSCILTQVDKASAPWPLIESLCAAPLPVALVSNSKSVADNLDIFKPDMLVAVALNSVKDRCQSPETQEPVPSFIAMRSAKHRSRGIGNA